MTSLLEKLFASDWFWSLGEFYLGIILLAAIGMYAYRESIVKPKLVRRYIFIARLTVWAKLFYAAFLTFAQYFVWSQNEISRVFLTVPADGKSLSMYGFLAPLFEWRGGYFTFYSLLRFWLPALASIAIAYLFLLFLRSLRKYKDRFFEDAEVELGWVLALVVGYPNFIVFLPLVFFLIIPTSIARMAILKKHFTTIGYPMILAGILAVVWGSQIIDALGWGALRV